MYTAQQQQQQQQQQNAAPLKRTARKRRTSQPKSILKNATDTVVAIEDHAVAQRFSRRRESQQAAPRPRPRRVSHHAIAGRRSSGVIRREVQPKRSSATIMAHPRLNERRERRSRRRPTQHAESNNVRPAILS
eukprot:CAMPEP_0198114888 /NCGR_PEP_ID=MMETSP1442-20131203/6132_1 /TAXON_ID= /ORGANISM="Craspedostauros australis, Strain CCMP3328" /LENGTH=132 /DNA_ID=CAMNT_0043772293 /DNA_START=124 /DNA_END=522 /DNA_ORIENTATION=+